MKAGLASTAPQSGRASNFVAPPVDEIAKVFSNLEILELSGQGGMGAVYKARQPGLDRLVALKILPPESTNETGFAERFAREARALAKLNHPNIVSVYDFGKAGELHYFLMEFVDGLNLRQLERAGRLSSRDALRIISQMCDALQFAHDEGIVHRDIKPENVMVDKRGRVKVTDFGLAKLLGIEPELLRLTGARDIMGTPHYMAPEQLETPQTVDHRADIYSLGVVFYELLTGELPLGKFAAPSKKVCVDVRLDEVVLHSLEKEPDRRYQHASEVKTDVDSIAQSAGASVRQAGSDKQLEGLQFQDSLRQVWGPAIGLLVTAILNWVGIVLLSLILVYWAAQMPERTVMAGVPMAVFPIAALIFSSLIFMAGLKMKRLQAYWLAVAGSVLAILITPGNLVGLPIGIWALVVLGQKTVRQSFAQQKNGVRFAPIPPVAPGGGGWKIAAVIVAAVLLFLAIPVGSMLVALVLPALHRAKAVASQRAAYNAVMEITLTRAGQQALDLDMANVLEIPTFPGKYSPEEARWLEQRGADIVWDRVGAPGTAMENRWGLLTPAGNELKLAPLPNQAWLDKTIPSQNLADNTLFSTPIRRGDWIAHLLPADAQAPLTFYYRTASGNHGLVHVQSFSEAPFSAELKFVTRPIRP